MKAGIRLFENLGTIGLICTAFIILTPCIVWPELKKLSHDEMLQVDAQGLANFTFDPEYTYAINHDGNATYDLPLNTWPGHVGTATRTFKVARLELNVETEFFLEADSMKCGLSTRDDFYLRHNYYAFGGDGIHSHVVNDHYQGLWTDLIPGGGVEYIFRGAQGNAPGGFLVLDEPLGPNKNNYDWDLNFQDVRLGESNANPFKMPNLVFKLYYDQNNKLRKIAFGSSLAEGIFTGNLLRYTGIVNPNLADPDRNPAVILDSLTKLAKNPVSMKRDSFIGANWQFFNFENNDTGDHRGFWFVLADHDDHKGWEMVCGYPEPMLDFDYRNPDLRVVGPEHPE